MNPSRIETFVLVVGGGPVGLSTAIELGWRGVPALLITENTETAKHPKCNSTNARSMEHFRRLGIANDLRSEGLPPEIERASAYVTRFCGYEIGRLPRAQSDWPTPEIPNNVSQIALERALRRHAENQSSLEVRFGWRLLSFETSDQGVVARIESVTSGETVEVSARFLIAADGASSLVRQTLKVPMLGEQGEVHRAFMGGTMLSYYVRSPALMAASNRKPSHSTWIINPQMRGLMFSQDGRERWVVHYQVPKDVDWRTLDPKAIVRELLGTDTEFEILSGGPWTGGLALVAERYQEGPIFLVGDAAHLFTPLGGMGMNTGIGDVMNLCWKLAAVHEGWAGARLLDSFGPERRPIGVRNSQFGIQCAKVMDAWRIAPNLEGNDASAKEERDRLCAQILVEDAPQYLSAGLQLGERYEDSLIVCHDHSEPGPDLWDRYQPTDRPGERAPHLWLEPGRALFDEFGKGFALIEFGNAGGAEQLVASAAACKLPLRHVRLGMEPSGGYTARLVLVRPDQHVAWRGDEVVDADAIIETIRGNNPHSHHGRTTWDARARIF